MAQSVDLSSGSRSGNFFIIYHVHFHMKMTSLIAALAFQISAASVGFAEQPCKSTVVGDLRIEQFESKMYGAQMTVRVWLPPGYSDTANTKRRYPTLYMFDGQTLFDECTAFHGEHELQIDETLT